MTRVKIFQTLDEARNRLPEGKPVKLLIGDEPYCLLRIDDVIKAFSNLCPHQQAPLSKGTVTRFGELVCPLHEYRFSLQTGEESSRRCGPVRYLTVDVEDGVFIGL